MENCKNCTHWKSEQAELRYTTVYGICTCYRWTFDIKDVADVRVLDRNNLTGKGINTHSFEAQSDVIPIGRVQESRYCLVTEGNFGCINFKDKK